MNVITPLTAMTPRVALFSGNYNYTRDGANRALNRLLEALKKLIRFLMFASGVLKREHR